MPTLLELRDELEAGMVIQKQQAYADGYEAIKKSGRKYVYMYGFEPHKRFLTFEELYAEVEPDASELTEDDLDIWEVEPERSPETAKDAKMHMLLAAVLTGNGKIAELMMQEGSLKSQGTMKREQPGNTFIDASIRRNLRDIEQLKEDAIEEGLSKEAAWMQEYRALKMEGSEEEAKEFYEDRTLEDIRSVFHAHFKSIGRHLEGLA